MKMKKVLISLLVVTAILAIGFYFAVPMIARGVIANQIQTNPSNTFEDIDVSWGGPQVISGLHFEDAIGNGDIDVTIHNSLFSLAFGNRSMKVVVTGNATINTTSQKQPKPKSDVPSGSEKARTKKTNSIPAINATISLKTITILGDEPVVLHDVQTEINLDPGMHFVASLVATTETQGSIDISINAPNLFSKTGEIDLSTSATCKYEIINTPIPTMNGIGGWSVIKMGGEISSPNLQESVSIHSGGTLAEYDTPRGKLWIKAQLLRAANSTDTLVFHYNKIDGVAELNDVPTTILSPLMSFTDIRIDRDIGSTMNLIVQRDKGDSDLGVRIKTEHILAQGKYNSENNALDNFTVVADLHSDLLQMFTNKEFAGSGEVVLHIDHLILDGTSNDDKPECSGNFSFNGKLLHVASDTAFEKIRTNFSAAMRTRTIETSGSALINDRASDFGATLFTTTKKKLHNVEDLWKAITKRLQSVQGQMSVSNLPISIAKLFVDEEQFALLQHFGDPVTIDASHIPQGFNVVLKSQSSEVSGNVIVKNNDVKQFEQLDVRIGLTKQSTSDLFGIQISAPSILHADVESLDLNGNSIFNATYDIGKQHTFIQGKTTRQKDSTLDLHVACTGIDTRFLDALCNCNGILADSLGSPLAIEAIVQDVQGNPVLQAGGTAPNAVIETSLAFRDGTVFTASDIPTRAELLLSPELTHHLLKDLGPVLSDIRSVDRPIAFSISNATVSADNDLAKLNATVRIDIGEVQLDSGSITMKLLPMFNSKHTETIPATFDPIEINIINGVANYKEFRLTLDNKYSIPYSGEIDFLTRKLHLKSAVPLTGLGYSIKELRGLATDIDVPILITGTIDNPVAKVDPSFDLGKLLQSAALSSLGDAIGGILSGDSDKEEINPLDLLEELFGGK
jgi:hypothetical protein